MSRCSRTLLLALPAIALLAGCASEPEGPAVTPTPSRVIPQTGAAPPAPTIQPYSGSSTTTVVPSTPSRAVPPPSTGTSTAPPVSGSSTSIVPSTPSRVVPAPTAGTMPPGGVSGSSRPPSAASQMSASDIRSTLVNNTATGIAANGETYYAWFGPTGQVRFVQGNVRDTGTWRILPDGRLCSQMARINNNVEQCYVVYRSGDALTYNQPDGTEMGSFSVLSGNPEDL